MVCCTIAYAMAFVFEIVLTLCMDIFRVVRKESEKKSLQNEYFTAAGPKWANAGISDTHGKLPAGHNLRLVVVQPISQPLIKYVHLILFIVIHMPSSVQHQKYALELLHTVLLP